MWLIRVDLTELPQPEIDAIEIFHFASLTEANSFNDHLRDLYGLDTNIESVDIETYDQAIERFVQLAGPSPE